ncbi:MAG: circularly permuted type 2 ATP-grasp protein, partial [Planctomycetota bacterium]
MSELMADYQPRHGYFDEACVGPGQWRPHWDQFARQLGELGGREINRRWEQAQRQLQELGVTYNPQDDTGQASRPWQLDAIPYLMPVAEWQKLAAAIEQRATLFDLILDDLFGDQSLIRDRVVPPDLWFAHPRFQPAYQGLPASKGTHLVLYAADLARATDGGWRVAGDRTRAPNGLGYVLENRIVTSRMLPNLFRKGNVVRLAQFFVNLRDTLQQLAPRARDNPRVVVWSQGSASAGFFEDA